MANVLDIQVLIDGPRNAVVKVTGLLDTANLVKTVVVNPANFAFFPMTFHILHLEYAISDQLSVVTAWEATVDRSILPLSGRGHMDFDRFGGLINDTGAGRTGSINLFTNGYTTGIQTFSLIFELVKEGGR
jgi:hypothetical protein